MGCPDLSCRSLSHWGCFHLGPRGVDCLFRNVPLPYVRAENPPYYDELVFYHRCVAAVFPVASSACLVRFSFAFVSVAIAIGVTVVYVFQIETANRTISLEIDVANNLQGSETGVEAQKSGM
jgi:hypothetical protein